MRKGVKRFVTVLLACCTVLGLVGCGKKSDSGVTEIQVVHYKPEAVKAFEEIAERFNETHDNIHLTIESPNEAMTILKTRFIREDYPDIIGIGGDINYSNFLDADLFMDISDFDGIKDVKQAYLDMDKELEFVPKDGIYALPFAGNAAGVLYNKDMFEEHGWKIPETWSEFTALCDEIEAAGIQPLYFGFKDTWTCLAPWNALAVGLADSDTCNQVNMGTTTFTDAYKDIAVKMRELLKYSQPNPYAYGYNDACTAFAREESAMYAIGSYLNSGIDLQFSVMKNCENKEAAYEVLRYLYEDETIQIYLNDQSGVACKDSEFTLPPMLDGMKSYIEEGRMADYQDHHYPSEMSVDAMIQTFLLDESADSIDTFLARFDKDWKRYNRDLIRKVQEYQKETEGAQ